MDVYSSPNPGLQRIRHSRMLLAGIQAEVGLHPRLKHSGVTFWEWSPSTFIPNFRRRSPRLPPAVSSIATRERIKVGENILIFNFVAEVFIGCGVAALGNHYGVRSPLALF
jgi:hypothetical protein